MNATLKIDKAINACKQYLSQVSLPRSRGPITYNLGYYLVISVAGAFIFGLSYYFIRRRRFIKSLEG